MSKLNLRPALVSSVLPIAFVTTITTTVPISSYAQTADKGPSTLVEELVVTARKREQNLQEVGGGVSLLSAKEIAQAQLRSTDDLATLIPALNVQASSGPSTSSFNIRGIGTRTFSPGVEPSVSTMLDGVVMGRSGMAFLDLVDIERIEVLRGPQGTLYGKNASGGVIHIITKDPSPEVEGTVSATAIQEKEYRFNGTISGPITDSLGYRITGSLVDDEGYSKNVADNSRVNGTENYNLRGKLLWQANEDLEFLWSSDYRESECECTLLSLRSVLESANQQNFLDQLFPVVPSKNNQDVNNDQETFSEIEASGHSLTVDWAVGNHVITSISAYRDWSSEGIVDLDNLPTNPIALSFPGPPTSDTEQFSQELRLASSPADWGSYVVGAYYFEQEVETGSTVGTTLIIPALRVARTEVNVENYSLFGEVNFSLTDNLELILGGRYTYDDISYYTEVIGTDNLVFPPEGASGDSLDEDDFSEKIALQWTVNDDAMVYASFVSGYKGPAFDTSLVARDGFVDPETSDAWETGLKSTWFDGRLIFNIAAFYAEYQDFQAEASVDDNPNDMLPGNFLVVNAGEVTTKGIEIEFISRPTQNWGITGGFAYTDTNIDEFPGGPCSGGQKFRGECPQGFQDLSGGDLPYTPKWKANIATTYLLNLESLPFDVMLGANVRSQDDVLYELSQDELTIQDAYSIVDFSTSLIGRDTRYRINAFVKNVFDKSYATLIFAQGQELVQNAYIHRVPKLAERTAGVELRYDF